MELHAPLQLLRWLEIVGAIRSAIFFYYVNCVALIVGIRVEKRRELKVIIYLATPIDFAVSRQFSELLPVE